MCLVALVVAAMVQIDTGPRGAIERYFRTLPRPFDEYLRVRRVERLDVSGTAASAVLTLDYVGSNLISVFLITTPGGDILLDTGDTTMLPQVMANIERLGFKPTDVRILLNSHGHVDHCGAFAEFRRRTRAMIMVSRADAELMERGGKGDFSSSDIFSYEPVTPDRLIDDGQVVTLGGLTMTAHLTPGHTKGCTTWTTTVTDGGRFYDVIFVCGLVVSPFKLTNNVRYPRIVEDEQASLSRLRDMHADVMLAAHGFWFDLEGKVARQKPGAPNPFVDPRELQRHVAEMRADLDSAVAAQERARR